MRETNTLLRFLVPQTTSVVEMQGLSKQWGDHPVLDRLNLKMKSGERLAISFLIYPTLRKDLEILNEKPFFSECSINPFTKYI